MAEAESQDRESQFHELLVHVVGAGELFDRLLIAGRPHPPRAADSAIAQELVKLLVDEIERSEAVALSASMPSWLRRLVALWDRLDAKVITFNYDTLLEQAVNASEMPWIDWQSFPVEPVGAVAVNPLKMHGSTNWWGYQVTVGFLPCNQRRSPADGANPSPRRPFQGWNVSSSRR